MRLLKSFILLILFSIISYNVHKQGKTFYDDRIKNGKITPKVFDIGMKIIPNLSSNKYLTFIANILPVVLPIVLLYNTPYLMKYYYIFGYIILIRYLFINLTILPKDKNCKDDEYTIENIILGHCYDKIFSGHFTMIYLLALFLYKYKIYTDLFYLGFGVISYGIMIISLRFHYTIDIAVAAVVTQLVFEYLK